MPTPRRSQRQLAGELLFETVPVISSGPDCAPVLIPTIMDGHVRCVPVTIRAGWLTQLVEQKRRTRDSKAVVLEFCDQVEMALKALAPADALPTTAPRVKVRTARSPDSSKAGQL